MGSRSLRGLAVLVVATALSTAGARAQDRAQTWQPPAPTPDGFDWIQFTSGEWLKGELIAMYDGSLEFDSDQLDTLTLDWDDIQQVRTARVVQVRFREGEALTGRLFVDGDAVRIVGDEEYQRARAGLMSIVAAGPAKANWSGVATVGLNFRRGNSEQVEANAMASALRRTVRSRISLGYLGNYNVTDDFTVTNNHRASVGADWFVTPRLFLRPIVVEYYRDPFQNYARRWTVGAAVGYQLVDTPRVSWEVDGGPAYQHTTFDSVAEGESDRESTAAVWGGTRYTNELSDRVDYTFDYRLLFTKEAAGRFSHHLVTGVSVESIGPLDVDLSFVWDRVQAPRPDSTGFIPKKDDFRLIFGVGFDF